MKLTEEIVVEKELLTRILQEKLDLEKSGDVIIRKMFNKCIMHDSK